MRKVYLVSILMIVAGIATLITLSNDVSSYATFKDAQIKESKVKISGTLVKDKEIIYDPVNNPDYFSFYLKDADGDVNKVILTEPKPQDFELAEQIVITGTMEKDEIFLATEVLTKCPSKYKNEELYLRRDS